jgi:hypothetical protein
MVNDTNKKEPTGFGSKDYISFAGSAISTIGNIYSGYQAGKNVAKDYGAKAEEQRLKAKAIQENWENDLAVGQAEIDKALSSFDTKMASSGFRMSGTQQGIRQQAQINGQLNLQRAQHANSVSKKNALLLAAKYDELEDDANDLAQKNMWGSILGAGIGMVVGGTTSYMNGYGITGGAMVGGSMGASTGSLFGNIF